MYFLCTKGEHKIDNLFCFSYFVIERVKLDGILLEVVILLLVSFQKI